MNKYFNLHKKVILLLALFICIAAGITLIYTFHKTQSAQKNIQSENATDVVAARNDMVERSKLYYNIKSQDVLNSMREVPRHLFVPKDLQHLAYEDMPLPIGYGQTISAPYMVARMTDLLELKPGEKVLEIGTGSGYQAAVLAQMGYVDVYSIEIVPELAQQAKERLNKIGYTKLHLCQGDGYFGWKEFAPFDAIIVTAAPDHLPQPLIQQLAEGGRMIIPIGPVGGYQTLWKFVNEKGELKAYNMGGVRFVPLVSKDEPQPMPIPGE